METYSFLGVSALDWIKVKQFADERNFTIAQLLKRFHELESMILPSARRVEKNCSLKNPFSCPEFPHTHA
jgi:hypothetical protein